MTSQDPPTDGSKNRVDTAIVPQTESTDQPSRFSTHAAMLILLLIVLTPAVGFWWLRDMAREAGERSALSHTRDMLIRHVARTRGAWPGSWDDLEEDFEPADADYGTPGLGVLKQAVGIDFTFDPQSVAEDQASDEKPPKIIWLKGLPDTDDVGEANARLTQALRQRRTPKSSQGAKR